MGAVGHGLFLVRGGMVVHIDDGPSDLQDDPSDIHSHLRMVGVVRKVPGMSLRQSHSKLVKVFENQDA